MKLRVPCRDYIKAPVPVRSHNNISNSELTLSIRNGVLWTQTELSQKPQRTHSHIHGNVIFESTLKRADEDVFYLVTRQHHILIVNEGRTCAGRLFECLMLLRLLAFIFVYTESFWFKGLRVSCYHDITAGYSKGWCNVFCAHRRTTVTTSQSASNRFCCSNEAGTTFFKPSRITRITDYDSLKRCCQRKLFWPLRDRRECQS